MFYFLNPGISDHCPGNMGLRDFSPDFYKEKAPETKPKEEGTG